MQKLVVLFVTALFATTAHADGVLNVYHGTGSVDPVTQVHYSKLVQKDKNGEREIGTKSHAVDGLMCGQEKALPNGGTEVNCLITIDVPAVSRKSDGT